MLFGDEHRKSDRFDRKATVMIESYNKGTAIKIRFNNALYKAAPKTYSGTVSWCKELVRDDFEYSYGVGIKYD